MDEREQIEARLRAYIHPNTPEGAEQEAAFDDAVDAQLEYEQQGGGEGLPPGVASLSVGNYSVTMAEPGNAAYTQASLCPAAWAILRNAGLLRRALPVAQRL